MAKYKRCKKCKELVSDVENCANCKARTEDGYQQKPRHSDGKRGAPTLDIQEGNSEEYF